MMTISNIFTSLILALWVSAIAILSVQNATAVSLKFLGLESIAIPVGVVLGFSASLGMIMGAIIPILWTLFSFSPNKTESSAIPDSNNIDF